MKILWLFFLLFQIGCATKYIVPGNRFITPESQGGNFQSQMEFQQAKASMLAADVSEGNVDNGVDTELVTRFGVLASTSLLDQMDIFWSHTGGSNSLLGAKFQFMGGSRSSKATGHKMAVTAAFGGNEHETDYDEGDNMEFEMKGNEFMLLYGFRFSEMVMTYASLSIAKYSFAGKIISDDNAIDGLEPKFETKSRSLQAGLELTFGSFFTKAECGYQQLKTTDTKDQSHFLFGYSLGLSF